MGPCGGPRIGYDQEAGLAISRFPSARRRFLPLDFNVPVFSDRPLPELDPPIPDFEYFALFAIIFYLISPPRGGAFFVMPPIYPIENLCQGFFTEINKYLVEIESQNR